MELCPWIYYTIIIVVTSNYFRHLKFEVHSLLKCIKCFMITVAVATVKLNSVLQNNVLQMLHCLYSCTVYFVQ